jgi:hypothetical protein
MILSADRLWFWQECRRRFLLETDWKVAKMRPKQLFDACLRAGIFKLCSGVAVEKVIEDAQGDLLAIAANPGMDVIAGRAPYELAKDLCAMLNTILLAMSRQTLLVLKDPGVIKITDSVSWQMKAWQDESGVLHRWVTVDMLDEDRRAGEIHSWQTAGDMAAANAPMTIHVIEIGRQSKGRYVSPWSRAWKHPGLPHLPMKFSKRDGTSLSGWTPVFLAESAEDPEEWVDVMQREGAVSALMHDLALREFPNHVRNDHIAQILNEAAAAGRVEKDRGGMTWRAMPMSRGACDGMIPCPMQGACYGPQEGEIDLRRLGLTPRASTPRVTGTK